MKHTKIKILFIFLLIFSFSLSSCTDKNAKIDESNKFLHEDYSEFVLSVDEVNEIMLSNYSNEFYLSAQEQKAVDKYKNEVLTVAIPVEEGYLDKIDGSYIGINYYTALQLEKDLGLTFEYVFCTPEEIVNNAKEFDIATGKNLSVFLKLYDTPTSSVDGVISMPYYSVKYASFSKVVSMGDIDLRNVFRSNTGVYIPYTESMLIDKYKLLANGYPNLAQSYSINDLIEKDYDFLVLPENSTATSYGYKRIPFRNYNYEVTSYFKINSSFDEEFISAINRTITGLKEKNLTQYAERVDLIKCVQGLCFTEEEKEFIKNAQPIKTYIVPSSYPDAFFDTNYDLYNGKLVALLERISSVTGLEFEYISNVNMTISDVLAALYNQDIGLGVGVEGAYDRSFYLKLSDNYLPDRNIYIGYKDSIKEMSDVYDNKIGTIANSSMDKYLTTAFPSKIIYRYNTLQEAYDALSSEEVDFLGVSKNIYYYLVNLHSDYDLKDIFDTNIPADNMFATPNTYEGNLLINIIDKVAYSVELDQIKSANYPLSEIDTVGSYRNILFLRIIAGIFISLLIVGTYFTNQFRISNKKNKSIRGLNKKLSSAFKISNFGILTNKLGSDYFIVDSATVQLLGLDKDDLFVEDNEFCIAFDVLVNKYLCDDGKENAVSTVKQAINSIKDSNKKEYNLQIAFKFAKDEREVKYFETVVTLEDAGEDNIIIILRDATKEALYEKYEKAVINSDSLTEAKNRISAYKLELGSHIGHTVAYINLDNFNQVNNTYGHRKGDTTLSDIVYKLLRYKYTIDVYRMNGDEFFAIFNEFSPMIADEILSLFRETIVLNNHELNLSASIGFLTIDEIESVTHDEVINICNFAMLKAKLDGKNRYVIVDESMLEEYKQANMLDSLLKRAIIEGDIIPYYQPYIDIYTNKVVGYETLMRWKTDEGILAPFIFLSIAIKSGDIYEIDLLMFKQAAIFLKQLQNDGLVDDGFVVSSNFTPITLTQVDPIELVKIVTAVGVMPQNMTIEITEQLFASDKAFEHIKMLKEYGFNIALDDFSVGHSSMAYLKKLKVDVLKLDKSLLDNTNEKTSLEIFKTLVNLGKSLDAKIVAEGVETASEIQVLKDSDVHIGQGYYFARPADKAVMQIFIEERNRKK